MRINLDENLPLELIEELGAFGTRILASRRALKWLWPITVRPRSDITASESNPASARMPLSFRCP